MRLANIGHEINEWLSGQMPGIKNLAIVPNYLDNFVQGWADIVADMTAVETGYGNSSYDACIPKKYCKKRQ